jgi:hypothetical protein
MSKAVIHGDTVYLAGIVADSPKGKSVAEQTKTSCRRLMAFSHWPAPARRSYFLPTPMIGAQDGTFDFTIPKRPIRKKIKGLPAFTTVTGGAYFFLPGIKALRYLATLE